MEIFPTVGQKGVFYFKGGELYDAVYDGLKGEEAALKLLAFEKASIRLTNLSNVKVARRINISLMNLILESQRHKDESKESGENI